MKKRFFIAICLLLSLCLASCEYADLFFTTGSTIITHTHLWESEWEHDATHHWHECKDIICNEVDSKEAHIWDEGTLTKEPTEAEAGEKKSMRKAWRCRNCPFLKKDNVAEVEDILPYYDGYCSEMKLEDSPWGINCDNYYYVYSESDFEIVEVEVEE
jgi:hypothetical protein